MKLAKSQLRYLGIAHGLMPVLINAVVCGVIGLVDYRNLPTLPVWGLPKSIALDLIATSFLLPAITCLIATPLTRRDLKRGIAHRIENPPTWIERLPTRLWVRAVLMGGIGLLTVGLVCALILKHFVSVPELERSQFVMSKIAFACCLGILVTPVVAIKALSEKAEQ